MNGLLPRRNWRFWLVTLLALAAVLVTASLGRWQLSRAAQKLALQAAIDERQRQPALPAQAPQRQGTGPAQPRTPGSARRGPGTRTG